MVNPATEYQVTSADALADASYTWNVIARDVLLNTASSPTRTFAVGPKTLTVTKTGDTSDGLCNADCSLREAIAAALSGDKVAVPAGTYTLTLGTELTIAKNLTLNGAGSGDTIIQAATSSADATSRVFNITSGNVAISGVAIQNGRHGTLGSFSGSGGGILQTSGGTLTLTNVTVSGNTAGVGGGGIYNFGGTVILTNSTVSGNTACSGGGGIYQTSGGTLTLTNSTVSGNLAASPQARGGGIHNRGSTPTLILTDSTVSGNRANRGGGIDDTSGTLTLTNSTVSGNSAGTNGGGGIYTEGGAAP